MSLFGVLAGPWQVEQAVIATLRLWLPEYAAEIERQAGLQKGLIGRPPVPEAYRGALDWLSLKDDWMPEVKVICNPVGEPERQASVYMQTFAVEVWCLARSEEGSDPEASARRNAGLLALATMLLGQSAGANLGALNVLEETVCTGTPRVEFLEPDNRRYAVGITSWQIHAEVANPNLGPEGPTPKESPGYEGLEEPYKESPEVKTATEKIKAVPISEPV